jgi:hypothetical protein
MLKENGQAGVRVTTAMREAGAALLGDPDLAFSHEEMAEAVYISMQSVASRHEAHDLNGSRVSRIEN